jgi:2-octaprenyl-6-methoxyphenol hydroxylase
MQIGTGIVVVGGGPVGATLALSLQQKGIPATVLEARNHGASHQDQRALALSYGSRMILERLGLWQSLASQATAIKSIHVSQRGSVGRSKLQAADDGREALGYVLSYGALSAALDAAIHASPGIRMIYGATVADIETTEERACVGYSTAEGAAQQVDAALAILADGGNSLGHIQGLQRKTREYGHNALVARVQSELPHANIAYERFTPSGPVALLPNGEEFSLVWTGRQEEISALMQTDDAMFLDRLHHHFGDRVGKFLRVGPRSSFPLKLAYLDSVAMPRLAVIGNAAQTMHPVAGQGFNIGLRDAWELSAHISATDVSDWGSQDMLQAYRRRRSSDTRGGLIFTDFLVNVFSNDIAGLSGIRAAGLGLLDVIKPFKRRLVEKMSFGA